MYLQKYITIEDPNHICFIDLPFHGRRVEVIILAEAIIDFGAKITRVI